MHWRSSKMCLFFKLVGHFLKCVTHLWFSHYKSLVSKLHFEDEGFHLVKVKNHSNSTLQSQCLPGQKTKQKHFPWLISFFKKLQIVEVVVDSGKAYKTENSSKVNRNWKRKIKVECILLENLKEFAKIWFSEGECLADALEDRIGNVFF